MKTTHDSPHLPAAKWPRVLALAGAPLALLTLAATAPPGDPEAGGSASLQETRLVMGKWIETQQIVSKERNDWQQGKEILTVRLELVKREITALEEKLAQSEAGVAEARAKRDVLLAQSEELRLAGAQLAASAATLEAEVRRLFVTLPEPLRERLAPLYQRVPEDPSATKATVAERFQNVLGILNEVNKANGEITVTFEVRELAGGKPSEVRVLYVGLAQAYYVSASGEAGIGRPSPAGWVWEPSKAVANDVLTALEIVQGKHTPAFVPLPVKFQ